MEPKRAFYEWDKMLTKNSKNDLRSQNFAEIASQPNRVKFNFWRWFWIAGGRRFEP